jgi:hypothetical protein
MSPAEAIASYRRDIAAYGETVQFRRDASTVEVKARVRNYQPAQLSASIIQGDRRVIVVAADLTAPFDTVPPKKGDKITIGGKPTTVQFVDDITRKIGSTLIAYDIQVRG